MKMKPEQRWSNRKPTEPGRYRVRDRVFGDGPDNVLVWSKDGRLMMSLDDDHVQAVAVDAVASHIEWRKRDDA